MNSESDSKMKVLMVEPRGIRGINHYAYLLCDALAEHADVVMATNYNFEMADKDRCFEVEYIFRRTRYYPIEVMKLLGYIRKHRPDLVHYQGFFNWPADLLAFRLLARSSAKLVLTVHDVLPHVVKPFHYRAMSAMYAPIHHIIAHDNYCKDLLTGKLGLPLDRVSVIPPGNFSLFDSQGAVGRLDAQKRLGLPQDSRVVLYFGVITKRKGVQDLIRAFPLIRKRVPDAYLIIAGLPHQVDWQQYLDLVEKVGIGDRTLVFAEHVPFEDVKYLFAAADVVCLPYVSVYQSGVLQTAYGFEKPVVATAVGGLPDVVENGKTGYLVPPQDAEAIAEATVGILQNGDLQTQMSSRIRHLVATKYSWTAIAKQTCEVYRTVLGTRGVAV